jgi:hypothetical protein
MTAAAFTPTLEYDENGYSFDEASDAWKSLCENLPCSLSLHWPGYATTKFEVTLKGEPAVIQPWIGNCPSPLDSLAASAAKSVSTAGCPEETSLRPFQACRLRSSGGCSIASHG